MASGHKSDMGASAPTTALSSAPPLPLSLLGGDSKEEEEEGLAGPPSAPREARAQPRL
ncbi:RNA polymerase I specific transcription initiation factor RRN3 protein [Zea mays]|uniref:RNA polymerase I specific transcription initiation factor RRN3 protein n=1 Tax=Zea mays TaxID=4577 RepID=A0A1D6MVR4_MAIZE|nr:RNA polymerase I specific transcription initiation factor RRN3 protein [Zea mays]ONM32902.1 RNA polymerase I specific transcription initiation factor RRN3 protein [Zea mays]